MKILAVDDDPVVLSVLMGILGRAGYVDVACCKSAAEARSYLDKGNEVDCFLLDIRMPDEDGISLCRHIRERVEHVNTPIIMLTAHSDIKSFSDAFDAGATEYATKPFDGLALGARIRTAVTLNKMRNQVAETIAAANQIAEFSYEANTASSAEARPYLGVNGAIEFLRLENFLLRLDSGIYAIHIFALQVEGLQEYLKNINDLPNYQALTAKLLKCLVSETAAKCLVSYAGNGVFVCVKVNGRPFKTEEMDRQFRLEIMKHLDLSADALDKQFQIRILRYCMRKLLSGRQAADFLRSSITKGKDFAGIRPGEEELRDALYTEQTGHPKGEVW